MAKKRVYILNHSATSVIKWMGQQGWSLERAMRVVDHFATGKLAASSVLTALRDANNPKYATGIAPLCQEEIEKLTEVANNGSLIADQGQSADTSQISNQIQNLKDQVEILKNRLADVIAQRPVETKITIEAPSIGTTTIEETVHPIFEQVLFHLECGDSVMLVGPSGCGKTHLAAQIARILQRDFSAISLSGGVTESKLFGRNVPNIATGKSEYQSTPFVRLYEKGGVFLLDEVDAADPNVLLSLNLALSNGHMVLDRAKNPEVNRHKDFVCLAAANTWGSGADRQYVGRNQQDTAFSARFVQLAMDYDKAMEFALCPSHPEHVERMHRYREKARAHRLERTISTRFILRSYNWILRGKDQDYVDSLLFAGWREDEIRKVRD